MTTNRWATRWIGGFCAVAALGGLPVRAAGYRASPTLADHLALPVIQESCAADHETAEMAWSQTLGVPVLLVRSVLRARELALQAAGVGRDSLVGMPANANRSLADSVKRIGATACFLQLDATLAPDPLTSGGVPPSVIWAQPTGGVGGAAAAHWLDCSDTVPDMCTDVGHAPLTLYGLHLTADPDTAGALLVVRDAALAAALRAQHTPGDRPDARRTLAQLQRLGEFATRHRTVLAEVCAGVVAAAGVPLLSAAAPGALAHAVALRIPQGVDAATFAAYVAAEHTPAHWLPWLRPLHYAALRQHDCRTTSAHMAATLLLPVGPTMTAEEIAHTVLGVVKAADYLGVRWWTDPARAADYAAWMTTLYGPGHDAFRPAFATD